MGIKIKKIKYVRNICIFILLYLFVMLATKIYPSTNVNQVDIYIWGIVINICLFVSIWLIKQIEDNKFSLITIVILICYLYNFGQVFMWTLGIHSETDIISSKLFGTYIPSIESVFKAEIYALQCFMNMILGILIVCVIDFGSVLFSEEVSRRDESIRTILYKFSLILGIVVIPMTFVRVIMVLIQSANYGYLSLYYSSFSTGSLLARAEDYFFPVLVGILIGSRYEKVKVVYSIYAAFVILYMFAGERGNWIYSLLVLIWMHFNYYKKIDYKKMIKLLVAFFITLYVTGIIVDLRIDGVSNITSSDIYDIMKNNDSFISRFIFEMGGTLGVLVGVMDVGAQAFIGFNNTFVSSFFVSFSSAIARALGVEYSTLALPDFFSRKILKINWGSGFNLFAECYINFEESGYLFMIVLGMIIAAFLKDSVQNDRTILRKYISCISAASVCAMFRDTSLTGFRMLVQFSLFLTVTVWFVCKIKRKN